MKRKRPFLWKRFASDLTAERQIDGLGLREAARLSGVHHATYCRAEHGKPIETADFVFLCWWTGLNAISYLPTRILRR
jgi:hypothetical protein